MGTDRPRRLGPDAFAATRDRSGPSARDERKNTASGSPPDSKAVTSGVSFIDHDRAREGEAVGPRKVTDRSHALEVEGPVRFARAGGAGRQDRNVCAARCGSGEGARDEGQFGATVPPVAADDDDCARLSHPEARAVLPTGVGGAAPPLATASLPRRRNQRCPRSPCRARRCDRREDRIGLRWHRWPPPVHSGGGDPIGPKFFQPQREATTWSWLSGLPRRAGTTPRRQWR